MTDAAAEANKLSAENRARHPDRRVTRGAERAHSDRQTDTPDLDPKALGKELRAALEGEVRFDDGSRALYATDASNYRQVPIGVVVPKTREDVDQDGGDLPAPRRAASAARRRHQPGRPVLQRRRRDRLLEVPQPRARDRSRAPPRPRRARLHPRRPARGSREARPDLRPRSRHPRPQHARRHDRQQLLRRAFGDGRQHGPTMSRRSRSSPTTACA